MKTTLMVMDSSGDTRIEFDETESKARDEAKALFERMKTAGARAFKINRDGVGDAPVTNFEQVQGEVLIVPRIVGG